MLCGTGVSQLLCRYHGARFQEKHSSYMYTVDWKCLHWGQGDRCPKCWQTRSPSTTGRPAKRGKRHCALTHTHSVLIKILCFTC